VDEVPLPCGPGRLWLAGKRYVAPDPEAALASVTADTVVCLCEDHELDGRYPGYTDWLRSRADRQALWFPVPDLHAPGPEAAARMVGELSRRVEEGRTLLVHCGAGMGRAGTVAALLLIRQGLGADEAVAVVAGARPGAGPEVGSQDLLVRGFRG
jgi:protein-tyrosine phosphatase